MMNCEYKTNEKCRHGCIVLFITLCITKYEYIVW